MLVFALGIGLGAALVGPHRQVSTAYAIRSPPTTSWNTVLSSLSLSQPNREQKEAHASLTSNAQLARALRAAGRTIQSWRREDALRQISDSIAVEDIPAALAQLNTFATLPGSFTLHQRLLARWADTEPESAMAYAQNLPRSGSKLSAIQTILTAWAGNNPQAATE